MNSAPRPVIRIVVADENVESAESFAMLLETYGHSARTAYDGGQAVALTFADGPDIVVLDIEMPVLTGYEAAAQIARTLPRTILVAISALPPDQALMLRHGAAFNAFVTKPAQPERVVRLLEQLVAARDAVARPTALPYRVG